MITKQVSEDTITITVPAAEIWGICQMVPGFRVQVHDYQFEFDRHVGMLSCSSCSNQDPDLEKDDEDEDECVWMLAEVVEDIARPFFTPPSEPDPRYAQIKSALELVTAK